MSIDYSDKLDAVDLIITALKEHEKRLDSLYSKMKNLIENLARARDDGPDKTDVKLEAIVKALSYNRPEKIAEPLLQVSCDRWTDFRSRCKEADAVAYKMDDDVFTVRAKMKMEVFRYSERIPKGRFKIVDEGKQHLIDKIYVKDPDALAVFNNTLKCGLRLIVKTSRTILNEGEYLINVDYELDSATVKGFISKELNVDKDNIVEGKITF